MVGELDASIVGIIKGNPGVIQADPDPDPYKTRTRTQGRGFSGLGSGFFGSAGSTTGIRVHTLTNGYRGIIKVSNVKLVT
jgi:hypothetical protein